MPVVGGVLPGSAADHAGLQANDRIDSIAGQPINTFEDIQRIVAAHPDATLSLTITRDGTSRTVEAHTEAQELGGQRVGLLGHPRRVGRVFPHPPACSAVGWRDADLGRDGRDGRRASGR